LCVSVGMAMRSSWLVLHAQFASGFHPTVAVAAQRYAVAAPAQQPEQSPLTP
jgi:hypothetical protein